MADEVELRPDDYAAQAADLAQSLEDERRDQVAIGTSVNSSTNHRLQGITQGYNGRSGELDSLKRQLSAAEGLVRLADGIDPGAD